MTLGRYEFLVPIAEGGMAAVWAGRLRGSRGFSKTVAIKTMLPSLSDDESFEQMFMDEATIASRIRHPNVVEILDLGEEEDVLYLVMEYVDGEPLGNLRRAAAKHGGIPRSIAVRIVADACAGLHAAHELKDDTGRPVGLVHRDISPQNILVTYDGVVKIVDFGVAKAAGRTSQATTAGQVKGKPPYMSPEQALGNQVDRRTDIFALGIILYQLTTGKHPFRGESDLVTLQNIVSDRRVVPPRAYDKEFPRELERVIMAALDRDREKRIQSCAEFEGALDDVFARELPRARTEDVGKFVGAMFAKKGEERRRALQEAMRLADERAERGETGAAERLGPLRASVVGGTPPSGVPSTKHTAITKVDSEPVATPYGATVPASDEEGRSSALRWIAGGVAVAAVAAALIVATGGSDNVPERVTAAASEPAPQVDETPAPSATPPEETELKFEAVAVQDVPDAGAARADVAEEAAVPPKAAARPAAPRWRPKKATVKKTAAAPAPAPAPRPAPTQQSGFVPPPVSNPGF